MSEATTSQEGKTYPPDSELSKTANVRPEMKEQDLEEFWDQQAQDKISWFEPYDTVLEWNLPYAKWFVGGKLNACYNCVDRHVENGKGDKVALHVVPDDGPDSSEARGHHLLAAAGAGRQVRQRAQEARRRQGRPGRHLHADDPRGRRGHAGLRPSRRAAHRGVRRVQRQGRGRALQRPRVQGPHHPGRGDARRQGRRAEDQRRRGPRRRPDHGREGRRRQALRRATSRWATATSTSTTSSRTSPATPSSCPCEPMESEDLLFLLYTSGSTGQAQGRRAHHRRLPGRHRDDPQPGLRRQGRLGLLVRGRHRLDHRAQLHRLRAAGQRRAPRCSSRASPATRTRTSGGRSSRSTG